MTKNTMLDNLHNLLSPFLLGCVFINGFFICAGLACFCIWMFILAGVFLSISLFFIAWTLTGLALLFIVLQVCVGFSNNGIEGALNSIRMLVGDLRTLQSYGFKHASAWMEFQDYGYSGLYQNEVAEAVDDRAITKGSQVYFNLIKRAGYNQS